MVKTIFICIVCLLLTNFLSAEIHELVLKENGDVILINNQGWTVKQFPTMSSVLNIDLRQKLDKIYILRKNYQVLVFDLNGHLLKTYYVDKNNHVWWR